MDEWTPNLAHGEKEMCEVQIFEFLAYLALLRVELANLAPSRAK